jgi:hypothetical protein
MMARMRYYHTPSLTTWKRTKAIRSTEMLAMKVKVFLEETSLSLFWVL